MSLRPQQPIPPVPDDAARVACAAFRRGNPCLLLRDRIGVMFGLMKTCSKLKISFYRYFGDRLHVPGVVTIPPRAVQRCRLAVTESALPHLTVGVRRLIARWVSEPANV